MRSVRCVGLALLFVAAGPLGCQTPAPRRGVKARPTLSATVRPPAMAQLSAVEVERGAKLFIAKCARCHPLYDPAAYDDAGWHRWMGKMRQKAHLKPEQEQLLSHYLEAFRTREK